MKAAAIPALTIWQPWASLIAEGFKPHEFRAWAAPSAYHNRRIAIHAGARPVRRDEIADLILRLKTPRDIWTTGLEPGALELLERWHTSPGSLPRSAIMCIATLGTPVRAASILPPELGDSDRVDHQKWAWPLTAIERLAPPPPARGAQGFWLWNRNETP